MLQETALLKKERTQLSIEKERLLLGRDQLRADLDDHLRELRSRRQLSQADRTARQKVWLGRWEQWLANDEVWRSSRVWDWALDAAISVGSADYANIQLVHHRLRGLELKAQRGFQPPFLEFFRFVNDDHSACGAALKRQRPVIVEDVSNTPLFANTPQLEVILDAGVRAVKSLPLLGRNGQMQGMLSVHYRQPKLEPPGANVGLKALARTLGFAMERHSTAAPYRAS